MTDYPAKLPGVENFEDLSNLPDLSITGEDPQVDNTARATFAAEALVVFGERTGATDDLTTTVTDLLANLMHFCDAVGLEFDTEVGRAGYHYSAELRGAF